MVLALPRHGGLGCDSVLDYGKPLAPGAPAGYNRALDMGVPGFRILMVKVTSILARGLFPKELPPPFHSVQFAEYMASFPETVPKAFTDGKFVSKYARHNLPRSGTLRRTLGIPNPVNFYRIAAFVGKEWKCLREHTEKSSISLTKPFLSAKGRAIAPQNPLNVLPDRRALLRSNSRYVLQTDISRFYHSIYTHSIPWALHGKAKAKSDHSARLVGNELDRLVRDTQDRQTIGIPIGPDTSLLIAEIILSAVDDMLERRGITNGIRYIDDFEFGFQTLAQAEKALANLQEILNDFQLALNPSKTEIVKLPCPTEKLAISELRTFHFRDSAVGQHFDLLHYFDKAFTFAHENPKEAVLRYAVSRVNGITVRKENWAFCQNLLLQCSMAEPGTISFVLNQLLRYRQMDYHLDLDHIADVLNSVIEQHAPQGHGGDVAWALWGLLVLRRKLRERASNLCAKMADPFVAVLLCDADDNKLVSSETDWNYLASLMEPEDLVEEMWLLSYEANRRGWFKSTSTKDHVAGKPAFNLLKEADVSFYDEELSGTVEPSAPEGWGLTSKIFYG